MTLVNSNIGEEDRFAGSRRRWRRLRGSSLAGQVLLWLFLYPFVLLYLAPWEELADWFMARSRPTQALIAVVALAVVFAGVTGESPADDEDQAAVPSGTSAMPAETELEPKPEPEPEAETEPETEPGPVWLYPDRLDRQEKDQERRVGESAILGGVEATVVGVVRADDVITVSVAIGNPDDRVHSFSSNDWRLQTPSGVVQDRSWRRLKVASDLDSADLLPGGTVAGNIPFVVNEGVGLFYVLWKPDPFSSARGVWGIDLE